VSDHAASDAHRTDPSLTKDGSRLYAQQHTAVRRRCGGIASRRVARDNGGFRAAVGPEGPLGRQIAVPRGKLLGGSSAVNAAVALRAVRGDFAAWAADGLTGWSFQGVLKTYRNLESADSGDDRFHGRSGPLPIHQRTYDELTSSVRAFIDTAEQQGYRFIDDPNAGHRSGVAAVPLNIRSGIRQNSAIASLTENVRRRPNLTVLGRTRADTSRSFGWCAWWKLPTIPRRPAPRLPPARSTSYADHPPTLSTPPALDPPAPRPGSAPRSSHG
jgi:choline dehydrogenase-like flavoprotein